MVAVVERERVVVADLEVEAGATQAALVEVILAASVVTAPKWQKSVAEEVVGKLVPVSVTWVPPLSWVKFGTAEVTAGDGRKVNVAARLLNSAPPLVETETYTVSDVNEEDSGAAAQVMLLSKASRVASSIV